MSTRSTIARKNLDNSFTAIYCHWDGYPSHNGKLLYENYRTIQAVNNLMDLGNLSTLALEIGIRHAFDKPSRWLPEKKGKVGFMEKKNPHYEEYQRKYGNMCVAYGRDRRELQQEAITYQDYDAFQKMLAESWTEWVYIWDVALNKWFYTNKPSATWFKTWDPEQLQNCELTPKAWEEKEKVA